MSLQNEDWPSAQTAIAKALQINPNSIAANELMTHIDESLNHLAYQSTLDGFITLEQSENWVEATQLAETIGEAEDLQWWARFNRVAQLADLEHAIDLLSGAPHNLSRPSSAQELDRIRGVAHKVDVGIRIKQKLDELNTAHQLWNTPVHIHLTSDRKTRIRMRPGGDLGTFSSKQIKVMPGKYVILGRRDGYREVRREVTLAPGSGTTRLTIKANEGF